MASDLSIDPAEFSKLDASISKILVVLRNLKTENEKLRKKQIETEKSNLELSERIVKLSEYVDKFYIQKPVIISKEIKELEEFIGTKKSKQYMGEPILKVNTQEMVNFLKENKK